MKSRFSLFICYFLIAIMLFSQNIALAANTTDTKASKYPKTPKTVTTSLKKTAKEKLNNLQSLSDDTIRQHELLASAASLNEAREFAEIYGGSLVSYSAQSGIATIKTEKYSLEEAMNLGASDDSYPPVFPNLVYGTDATRVNDPLYTKQYFHEDMNVSDAWNKTMGKSSVIVAVIDTGVDYNHEDLKDRISPLSYNSTTGKVGKNNVKDTNSHGTHVSGIIAATANNNKGGSGVAPGVTIMAIKANQGGSDKFSSSALIDGIYYAVKNGAQIINLSLGREFHYGDDPLEHRAIQYAVKNGVTVIAAAGNESSDAVGYPAAYSEVISVSALGEGNVFDDFYSNYGSELDISAPGSNIYSTVPGNAYASCSGTSMATPAVVGVAALIKSIYPKASPNQVRSILCSTAVDKGSEGFDVYYGHGAVNAGNALKSTLPDPNAIPTPTPTTKPTATPKPTVDSSPTSKPTSGKYCTINFNSRGGNYTMKMVVMAGKLLKEPSPPKKYDDTFLHWADSKHNIWKFDEDRVYNDINLYAMWQSDFEPSPTPTSTPSPTTSCTVSFDSRGGSYVPEITVSSGSMILEPGSPTKYDDIFLYWQNENNYPWDFNSERVYNNMTLYAVWYSDLISLTSLTSTPVTGYKVNFGNVGYVPNLTGATNSQTN